MSTPQQGADRKGVSKKKKKREKGGHLAVFSCLLASVSARCAFFLKISKLVHLSSVLTF